MKKLFLFLALASTALAQSYTGQVGQTATLSVTADGTSPFTYQWFRNGVALPGVTQSSFQKQLALTDSGTYRVVVSNPAGSASSEDFTLTVTAATSVPVFTLQPANKSVSVGQTATFTALASGSPSPTFQWMKNGVAIPGATAASYVITSAQAADVGNYSVRATNSAGSVTSAVAILTVTIVIPSGVKVNFTLTPVPPISP